MREPQKEDAVTQEPASPRVVDVVAEESPEKVAVTQEPAPPEIASNVQNVQSGTFGDKVWIDPLQNFIDLDSDKEEHHEGETLNPIAEISILRMEVIKWKIQVEEYQEGIVSLTEHKNIIKRLEEKWVEDRMTQRL